jgi:hypothetical protein
MNVIGTAVITLDTVVKLVVGALVAGLSVTLSFSLIIYFTDRSAVSRRGGQREKAILYQVGAGLAVLAVAGLIAYGFILMASKPK